MAITKADLRIGTRVRCTNPDALEIAIGYAVSLSGVSPSRPTYIVKDLFDRSRYDRPGWVAIGPEDIGFCIAVRLSDLETVTE